MEPPRLGCDFIRPGRLDPRSPHILRERAGGGTSGANYPLFSDWGYGPRTAQPDGTREVRASAHSWRRWGAGERPEDGASAGTLPLSVPKTSQRVNRKVNFVNKGSHPGRGGIHPRPRGHGVEPMWAARQTGSISMLSTGRPLLLSGKSSVGDCGNFFLLSLVTCRAIPVEPRPACGACAKAYRHSEPLSRYFGTDVLHDDKTGHIESGPEAMSVPPEPEDISEAT